MKRVVTLFRPILFPIFLAWLPVLGLMLLDRFQQKSELESKVEEWKGRARHLTEEFRSGYTFENQIGQMAQVMKRRFARITIPGFRLTGPVLEKVLLRSFAPSHLVPGTKVYGFSCYPAGKTESLAGAFLATGSARLLGSLLRQCLESDAISGDEASRLAKRIRSFFGDDMDFDMLARSQRGKVFPGFFSGKKSLMLWDAISTRREEVGMFLMVFPFDAPTQARHLERALNVIAGRYPGMTPLLIALPGEHLRFPLVTTDNLTWNAGPMRLAMLLTPKGFQWRQARLPYRQWVVLKNGAWAWRDTLRPENGHELVIYGRAPRIPSSPAHRALILWSLVATVFMLVLLTSTIQRGSPPTLTVRGTMMVFFLFLAVVAMASLFGFGNNYIRTARERKADDALKNLRERLQGFDSGFSHVLEHHDRVFQAVTGAPGWLETIMAPKGASGTRLWQKTTARLRALREPVHLRGAFAFGFTPHTTSRAYVDEGVTERKALGHLEFHQSFMTGVASGFRGLEHLGAERGKGASPALGSLVSGNIDGSAFMHYLTLRRRSAMMDSESEKWIIYYDFFARQEKLHGGILLLADLVKAYTQYLRYLMETLAMGGSPDHYSFSCYRFGGFEPVFPREEKFWNAGIGRELKSVMDVTAEIGGERVLERNARLFMALPCRRVSGFVVAGTTSLVPILEWEERSRQGLLWFLFVAVGLTVFLGMSTARHLLVPLADVAHGLEEVGKGNLEIRLGQPRNDELGDLCQAFDQMIQGIAERRELGRFVSGHLDTLVGAAAGAGDLKPCRQSAALLVSDLRSFTTLSETYPARDIVAMLNRHHQTMAEAIRRQGGFVELFIGDAVVAYFPDDGSGQGCAAALRAACDMMVAHRGNNQARAREGLFTYEIGIGIDYGEVLAGGVGAADRREYVILGKARVHAEKLEACSKAGSHTRIICSPTVTGFLPGRRFHPLPEGVGQELEDLEG